MEEKARQQYRVNALGANKPNLVTLVNGTPVALHGKDITIEIPAQGNKLVTTRTIKGATQSQLEVLYKEGNPFIELR